MKGPRKQSRGRRGGAARSPARAIEVEITENGAAGDGVAMLDGERVFVPWTAPGDRVVARIEGRRGEGLAASLVEVLSPGPERVAPPCPHFGTCGGCSLQHLSGRAYAEWKRGLVVTALCRQGLETEVAPLIAVPPGTRRRAAFAFARRRGEVLIGFNTRASHRVVDIEICLLLEPPLLALLAPLRRLLAEVVADGEEGDAIITLTAGGIDLVVEAPARLDLFDRERLAAFAEAADLARLSWRRPGERMAEPVARRRPPVVMFGGIAVEPPPGGFLQPSLAGERAIAELVVAAVGKRGPVADLFAGCGSFTFPLARHVPVHAVEGDAEAAGALKAAADAAGEVRVSVEARDLDRRPLLPDELKRFAAVVFDPPRAGAAQQAAMLARGGPPLVVAVSCRPQTLARDARLLVDAGYRLGPVTPIDQFPWSAHVEAVAVFSR